MAELEAVELSVPLHLFEQYCPLWAIWPMSYFPVISTSEGRTWSENHH